MKVEVRNDAGGLELISKIALRVNGAIQDLREKFGISATEILVSPEVYQHLRNSLYGPGEYSRPTFMGLRLRGIYGFDMECMIQ